VRNPGIFSGNHFKLGLFGSNCSGGLSFADIPERWSGSWEDNLALARLADETGIECLVANARWKGYGGRSNVNLESFETITWACGLLAKTRSLNVFATVHLPLVNPVFAAKQMVTTDHVAEGRFGVNVFLGAKEDEFAMFGIPLDEHDRRYDYGEEWWQIVTGIWSSNEPFDFAGRFFDLRAVIGLPHPYGGRKPAMMNAGISPKGRAFAIRNSDLHLDVCVTTEESAPKNRETKALALEQGRTIQEWTPVSVVCRPTRSEVEDFLRYCLEHADWEALDVRDNIRLSPKTAQLESKEAIERMRRADGGRAVIGRSHYPAHGTPDEVAASLAQLHRAGFDGAAMGFVNYLQEVPYFVQEVVPRLERMGLRGLEKASIG